MITSSILRKQTWMLTIVVGLTVLHVVNGQDSAPATQPKVAQPNWIWSQGAVLGKIPKGVCFFRRSFKLESDASVEIEITADDAFELFFNGNRIGNGNNAKVMSSYELTPFIRSGKNTIGVKVTNSAKGSAGLAARLKIVNRGKPNSKIVTDTSWKTSTRPLPLWNRRFYSDSKWPAAQKLGGYAETTTPESSQLGKVPGSNATAQQNGQNPRPKLLGNAPSGIRQPKKNKPSNATTTPSSKSETTQKQIAKTDSTQPQATTNPSTEHKATQKSIDRSKFESPPIRVPKSFQVQQVAGNDDVGSLIAITFNEFGHIVASRENGSLIRITKTEGDYHAVHECCAALKNVQGILALNGHLFVTGDGADGSAFYQLIDQDADGYYETSNALIKFKGTHGEHGPHGVALGPDGFIYVLVGNHSYADTTLATKSSYRFSYEGMLSQKMEDPTGHAAGVKAPGGTILRYNIQTKETEMVAGGLRNPYDLAFDRYGNLFTHDSDMESDEGSTWYRETRVLNVAPGAEFGWRSGWSKWPEYFIDNLPVVTKTGRGSPTGMVVYNHNAFPSRYKNTTFSGDWSSGKIWVMRNVRKGAGFEAKAVTFATGTPLNVTDLAVGPDGALYFSTGGRGTSGSIYRVVYQGSKDESDSQVLTGRPSWQIQQALQTPQLNSAFSRQKIATIQSKMGKSWNAELFRVAKSADQPGEDRIKALQIMRLFGPMPSSKLLIGISNSEHTELRIAAVSQLAFASDELSLVRLKEMLSDRNAAVRRAACEALDRRVAPVPFEKLEKLLASSDRHEAWAARKLLERTSVASWQEKGLNSKNVRVFLQAATGMMTTAPEKVRAELIITSGLKFMEGFINDHDFVDLLRLFQLTLHRSGLQPSEVPELVASLSEEYPSADVIINRELVRLLSHLQVDSIADRYFAELERKDHDSSERLHLAIHLAMMKQASWTREQKLKLYDHLTAPKDAGSGIAGYLQNVAVRFSRSFSSEEMQMALEAADRWPAAALAAVLKMGETLTLEQIETLKRIDQQIQTKDDETFNRLKVVIVAVLARDGSEPSMSYLRSLFDQDKSRRQAIAFGLAENIDSQNWPYLVRSLPHLEKDAAREILKKLLTVTRWPNNAEPYESVILTAEMLGDQGADDAIALLEHWQGFQKTNRKVSWRKALFAWKKWYANKFPNDPLATPSIAKSDQKKQPIVTTISDQPVLNKIGGKWKNDQLLEFVAHSLNHNTGSAINGRKVFVKAECSKCHRFGKTGESMGPILTNVAKRFRVSEVLESIVEPSKVVSDQYLAKSVITAQGKVYHGVVGGGGDGQVIVLQSTGEKIRIDQDDIEDIHDSSQSAMPAGLLDDLTPQEIADLFAYMLSPETQVAERIHGDLR